ncbi:YheC/YheD family protein [Sutcliffiella horikoshii]|uniref:YheC/YheD family endospore coat-associated protein n=1 Tax=Sutcliffiella horikoshii TaxID=79883 RepID=UPI001F430A91|nr:YheC/YheD family protein [Sutcliffiella horikoshii]MCG1022471.1 YheC/YheD family protein [Sutcliffiella horikoshii]
MNFQAVRVIPIEMKKKSPVPIIQISGALAKRLKLPEDISICTVQCSRNTIPCNIVNINIEGNLVRMDRTIQESLLLFEEERTYLITYDAESNKLHIGPVIALLTEISIKENEQIDLKSIEDYCMELANYSEDIGVIFYVFTLHKELSEKSMEGFYLENNMWNKALLPFPQVVHNRLHKRTNEKSEMFREFTDQLQEWSIPYFNDHFLDKWTVHEQLAEAEHLLPYLPDTALFSAKRLEAWLETYSVVFLKPINGSQGKQIFKVCKTSDGFNLDYSSLQQQVSQTYSSFHDLYKRLSPHIKKRQYILQQGLNLVHLDERPVDFRYLCHRTENNRWQVTSITARASKSGSFVSNLAQGGEMLSVNHVLGAQFDAKEMPQIRKHLKELALEVAREIGAVSEGIFGELGIDLAIDTTGHPWIIEVNTKPSKNLDQPQSTRTIRPSAKAVILYCLYLIHEHLKER